MRHKVSGKQLCIKEDHRRAMIRNLAAGLFEHGQIETTMAMSGEMVPLVQMSSTSLS